MSATDESALSTIDPEICAVLNAELQRQQEGIELIASENFASPAVLAALGSVLTNKYAEGYPGRRYYGGCEEVDRAEQIAIDRVKALFGAEHANVQPHSGSQANMAAYLALINPGDTIMGMDLNHGGHLTHGHKVNFSGKLFQVVSYGVAKHDERIDYAEVRRIALEAKPRLIITGASAYPRQWDFAKFREIAEEVGAYLLADMAHFAGLAAAGLHPNPTPFCDVVTSTTHKTLRGPRAGLILCKEAHAKKIDSAVFPGMQGGPLMHVIAAKAVCFREAAQPAFRDYSKRVLENAAAMAEAFLSRGYRLVSGGTDNHLMLVDVRGKGLTGKEAETAIGQAGITVNKNQIPFDTNPPTKSSGIRVGTPAITTRGMGPAEMRILVDIMDQALSAPRDVERLRQLAQQTREIAHAFPLYPNMRY